MLLLPQRRRFEDEDLRYRTSRAATNELLKAHRRESQESAYKMQNLVNALENLRVTGPDDPRLVALLAENGADKGGSETSRLSSSSTMAPTPPRGKPKLPPRPHSAR